MTAVHLQSVTSSVLFDDSNTYVLAEAFRLLKGPSLPDQDKYKEVLDLCAVAGDHTVVAKIVVAAVAGNPDSSAWLGKVATVFGTEPPVFEKVPLDPNRFVDGIVLGLFQASNWIDANQVYLAPYIIRCDPKEAGMSTAFEREFPRAVVKVITGRNGLLRQAEESHRAREIVESLSVEERKFRGELTNAVHAYVRCTGMRDVRRMASFQGVRIANVQQIVDGFCDYLSQRSRDARQLTRWGELVLDNIAYAFFGQMAPYARAQALNDYVAKLLDFSREQAKATS